jgi:hypothetical protein
LQFAGPMLYFYFFSWLSAMILFDMPCLHGLLICCALDFLFDNFFLFLNRIWLHQMYSNEQSILKLKTELLLFLLIIAGGKG